MRRAFLHHFGKGVGFGAELLDLSWSYYHACCNDLSFAMHTSSPPQGVAVGAGWSEYFSPFCPDVQIGRLSSLNRHLYGRKARFLRKPFRLALDAKLGRRFYYMFDRKALAKRRELSASKSHALDRSRLLRSIYRLNQQTISFFESCTTGMGLDEITIAVHVRRGDKITEAPYADLNRYVRSIQAIPNWKSQGIYIMSDSSSAQQELLDALGIQKHNAMANLGSSIQGYCQQNFNKKMPSDRKLQTLNLICEIEIARKTKHFIGTSTSNLYHLIGHLREENMPGMLAVEALPDELFN